MESICPICKKPYDGVVCSQCTVTDLDVSGLMASEGLQVESDNSDDAATAFLVDLVSNRKIPITTPRCKVGRDDLNDIVISGDQSISRFHFVITKENNQYFVQDGKSRHGTFLNGNQITAPEPIHDGDVLKVGVSLFWFVIETASSSVEADRSAPVDLEVMDQQELEFMVPEPISSLPAGNGKQEAAQASELETSPRVQPIRSKRPDNLDSNKKDKSESKKTAELASPRIIEDVDAEVTSSSSKVSASVDGTGNDSSNDSSAVHADAAQSSTDQPQSDHSDQTIPPGKINEELSNSLIGKIKAANNKKEPAQESFLVDEDGTTQSMLLNSISNSLKAESSSSVIGADGEFALGDFTFFEPLTEVPKEESQAEPVRGEESKAEAVGKADADGKAETDGMPRADEKSSVDGKSDGNEKSDADRNSDADKNSEVVGKADQSEVKSAQETDASTSASQTEPVEASTEDSAAEPISSSNLEATAASKDALSETSEKSEQPEHSQSAEKSEVAAAETGNNAQPKSEFSLQSFSPSSVSDASSMKAEGNHQHSAAEKVEPISSTASETAKVTNELPEAAEAVSEKEDKTSTLDKFAEIVGEVNAPASKKNNEDVVALSKVLSEFQPTKSEPLETKSDPAAEQKQSISEKQPSSNGAKSVMTIVKEPTGGVPDWCKRYFSDELNNLSNELTDLNEQVRAAQQKIKDVEGRVALTKGVRNTLLTAQGEELVEACGRVLTLLGWRVKVSDDDKHELRLDTEDKNLCIARIVWTETQADRTHLGQLSISQTRYWCEQGIEPKGILIISKSNDSGPSTLSSSDFNSELAEYATKKNVCLMTTLQLLAVYKDIALHSGAPDEVRATILASNGWLSGFALEPGDIAEKDEPTNKLSSLLSA